MATKDTPKKFYSKSGFTKRSSSCRLCKSVVDRRHSKDLFNATNCVILNNAQVIYGGNLHKDSALPHLICRPCERRLDNAIKFKKTIAETQESLEKETRKKRCLELSPSTIQPSSTVARTSIGLSDSSRRRSLDFKSGSDSEPGPSNVSLYL